MDALLGPDDSPSSSPSLARPATRILPTVAARLASFASLVASSSASLLSWSLSPVKKAAPDVVHYLRLFWGKFARLYDAYEARTRSAPVTMDFGGEEWGVATLKEKEEVGGEDGIETKVAAS